MSTYGVVSTISPHVLNYAKQQSVIKFETEYSAYVNKGKDVNRGRATANRLSVATIKKCLEPSFLHNLCIIGHITDASTAEEASDDAVKQWFDGLLKKDPKDLSERVRSAVNSVSFQRADVDPQGNVTDFIFAIVTALDKTNASSVLKEQKACENLLSQLNYKLQPTELRMRIQNE